MPRSLYRPLEGIWHSDEFAALYLAVRVYGDDYNVLKRHLLKRTAADIAGALKSKHFFNYCQRRKLTPQGEVFYSEPIEINADDEAQAIHKNEEIADSAAAAAAADDDDDKDDDDDESDDFLSSSSSSSSSSSDSSSDSDSNSNSDDDDDDDDDSDDDRSEDEAPASSFVSSQFGFTCVACGSRSLTHVCAAAPPPHHGKPKKKTKKKKTKAKKEKAMKKNKKPEPKQMQLRGKPQKSVSPMRKVPTFKSVTSETVLKVFLNGSLVLPQSSWRDERDDGEPPSKRAKWAPLENDEHEQRSVQVAVSRARAMFAEGQRQAKSARKLARDVGQSCSSTDNGQVAQHRESAQIGVYSGQVNGEDQAHGSGVAVGPDGHTFAGQWKNGLPDGCGLYTFANANTFAGSVVGGKLSGHGVLTFASGVIFYEGEWLDNDIEGCGKQYCTNGELMHSGYFSLNRAVGKR